MSDSLLSSSENIIEIKNLTRQFDSKIALDKIDLAVPKGGVFGLVGENGSGKTTLIKHLLGLYRAQGGTVRVFGLDPVKDPVGVLSAFFAPRAVAMRSPSEVSSTTPVKSSKTT